MTRRVLVADDDEVLREMLSLYLKSWDYEPVACQDGNDAWEVLQGSDPPRLLLLDWMMPGMDGVEVCNRVRASSAAAGTYIIMLTSKKKREDIVRGLDAGADDYVTKPFDEQELEARVRVGARVVSLQDQLLDLERSRVLTHTTGAAAHELNQPLAVILASAQLLLRRDADGPNKGRLEMICTHAKKAGAILHKMTQMRQYTTRDYAGDAQIVDFDIPNQ